MNGWLHALSVDWMSVSDRLVFAMTHLLWQGALIAMVSALISETLRSPRARYLVNGIALALMLVVFVATFLRSNVGNSGTVTVLTAADGDSIMTSRQASVYEGLAVADARSIGDANGSIKSLHGPVGQFSFEKGENVVATIQAGRASLPTSPGFPWRFGFAALYVTGMLAMFTRIALGVLGGSRFRRAASSLAEPSWVTMIASQCESIGLRTAPMVATCSRVTVPVVLGILKPIVLLPTGMTAELDREHLRAILCHELAHIRRMDPFWSLLQRCVESILFFHPAMWWLSRRVSDERENCCDDLAIGAGCDRLKYVDSLISAAEVCLKNRSRSRLRSQLSAMGEADSQLRRRVHRLLRGAGVPGMTLPRAGVLAVAFSVLAIGGVLALAQADSDAATESFAETSTEDKRSPVEGVKPERVTGDKELGNNDEDRGKNDDIVWAKNPVDGLLPGVRLVATAGIRKSGDPIVLEYLIKNISEAPKEARLRYHAVCQPCLHPGSLIDLRLTPKRRQYEEVRLDPGEVLGDHLIEFPTDGFQPGDYLIDTDAYFWMPVRENPRQSRGLGLRQDIPVTIGGDEQVSLSPAPLDDPTVHWGEASYGLRLGARRVYIRADGASVPRIAQYRPGDSVMTQLLVHNSSPRRMEFAIRIPHRQDGWLKNVTDQDGNFVSLHHVIVSMFSPDEAIPMKLDPGQTATISGVPLNVIAFHERNSEEPEANRRTVGHASFGIVEETPKLGTVWDHRLVSSAGLYGVSVSVRVFPMGLPDWGVQLVSAAVPFEVISLTDTGELDESEQEASEQGDDDDEVRDAADAVEETTERGATRRPEQEVTESNQLKPIRIWKRRLVSAVDGKPIQGVQLRVNEAVDGSEKTRVRDLVTDPKGQFQVRIRDGEATSIELRSGAWWMGGICFVGDLSKLLGEDEAAKRVVADPDRVTDVPVWPGQYVTGRLVAPDQTPVGGAALNVGVYLSSVRWKKKLGMGTTIHSFDHGDWPNWSVRVVTKADGTFSVAVPPSEARSWVRVGTTRLGFSAIDPNNIDPDGVGKALANYVPLEVQMGGSSRSIEVKPLPELAPDQPLDFGDIQLQRGVIVRGRVVDSQGKGLGGVHLTTGGAHGPHSGRSATSGLDGAFSFYPVAPGSLTIRPDARRRDGNGKVISGEVQAVFVDQEYEIPDGFFQPFDVQVKAVDETELVFEWIDRRAKPAPVSYYGGFTVNGQFAVSDSQTSWWRSDTKLVERDGKSLLVVKVPKTIQNLKIHLSQDKVVTASYEDETGRRSGPGSISLDDFLDPRRRIIYGDEPRDD